MPIPSEISALIDRLNQELNLVEQEATAALSLVRLRLDRFPTNPVLIQLFATLNNYILFVETSRRRIESIRLVLGSDTVPSAQIQEAGEDLARLGQVLEAKIVVNRAKSRLENWE